MLLSIEKTWTPSASEWDDAWTHCPYSTYFHSREWAEIWAEYSHGKITPAPMGVTLSDGTQIILPFSQQTLFKGLSRQFISSPAGAFGGWLAKCPLDEHYQAVLMKWITKQCPDLIWRFNPYEQVLHPAGIGCITNSETHVLELSGGFESIYRGWTKGHSSAARQARKAGVEIDFAESQEDWENYFHVYEDSLKRWGENTTMAYTQHFFELLFLRASPNVRLWLAKYDGLVIAGAICFYSPSHVVYWHGAALSSHFELRPVHLLMYDAIKDATERGFKWFDFNPSGELEGVKAFKRSFGATPLESNVWSVTSTKQQLIKSIWTSLRWVSKGGRE